jgi:hypothetical protein
VTHPGDHEQLDGDDTPATTSARLTSLMMNASEWNTPPSAVAALTPAPSALARPASGAVRVAGHGRGKDRCDGRNRAVDHPDQRGLHDLKDEVVLLATAEAPWPASEGDGDGPPQARPRLSRSTCRSFDLVNLLAGQRETGGGEDRIDLLG